MNYPAINATTATAIAIITLPANANNISLLVRNDEVRIDSRELAQHLDLHHDGYLFPLIQRYADDLNQLGAIQFQPLPVMPGSKQFAVLNEDQAFLLLTFLGNSAAERLRKISIVREFRAFRRLATQGPNRSGEARDTQAMLRGALLGKG